MEQNAKRRIDYSYGKGSFKCDPETVLSIEGYPNVYGMMGVPGSLYMITLNNLKKHGARNMVRATK